MKFLSYMIKKKPYGAVEHPALPGLEINFVSKRATQRTDSLIKTLDADWSDFPIKTIFKNVNII